MKRKYSPFVISLQANLAENYPPHKILLQTSCSHDVHAPLRANALNNAASQVGLALPTIRLFNDTAWWAMPTLLITRHNFLLANECSRPNLLDKHLAEYNDERWNTANL